jgi:hypothetical protein
VQDDQWRAIFVLSDCAFTPFGLTRLNRLARHTPFMRWL